MARGSDTRPTYSVHAADQGLAIERRFTTARRAPVRRDRVGAPRRAHRRPGQAGLRAARRRVPQELVTERDQHRRPEVLPRTARNPAARALGQADGRPRRRHDRRPGAAQGGYFASSEDADTFEAELTHILVNQQAAFNSPVWFNVGFEESPQCSACQPYHALVSTPEGMVPIGKLVEDEAIGREIYDAHGTTQIVAVKDNGRKPVYRVTLRNGSFVEATADHVVKAVSKRRTTPQWLRIDELRIGMRMHLHPHRARRLQPAFVAAGHGDFGAFDASGIESELLYGRGTAHLGCGGRAWPAGFRRTVSSGSTRLERTVR